MPSAGSTRLRVGAVPRQETCEKRGNSRVDPAALSPDRPACARPSVWSNLVASGKLFRVSRMRHTCERNPVSGRPGGASQNALGRPACA